MKNIFYYSSLYTIFSMVTKLFSFIVILWLGSSFSSNKYAEFALLFSLHQGITTFSIAGINESVAGFLKEIKTENEKNYLFSNVFITIIPSSIFVFLLSMFFYLFYLENKNPELLFTYVLFTIISSILLGFSTFKSQMNRLREDHFSSLFYLFIPQILMFLGGATFIYFYQNIQAFFIGSSLSILFAVVIGRIIIKKSNLKVLNGSFSKNIIKNAFPYYLIAVLGWMGGYGNNFIINIFFDNFEIAAFTFIYTFSGIMLMVSNSLNQVWAPRFYNNFGKISFDLLELQNNFFYGLLAIFMGIVVSIIILVYPIIIELIGGNLLLYKEMKLELYLTLLSYVIYTPIWHYRIHYYANSEGKNLLRISTISSILSLISMILCIVYLEKIGIYYGFLSITLINLILIYINSNKKWNLKINWIGMLIGFLISFITYYLSINDYSNLFSVLFLTFSMILTGIYISNHKITKIT